MTIRQKEKIIKERLTEGRPVFVRLPSGKEFHLDYVLVNAGRLLAGRFKKLHQDITDRHCMSRDEDGDTVVLWRDSPWIVAAAQRHNETKEIICGPRHFSPIMRSQMSADGGPAKWGNSEGGFVDQFDQFYTREQAYKIAKHNGQIRFRCGGDKGKLFSENLW